MKISVHDFLTNGKPSRKSLVNFSYFQTVVHIVNVSIQPLHMNIFINLYISVKIFIILHFLTNVYHMKIERE